MTVNQAKWLAAGLFIVGMILVKVILTWLVYDVISPGAVDFLFYFAVIPCIIIAPFIWYRAWKSGAYKRRD
jgi:hypothetical protein